MLFEVGEEERQGIVGVETERAEGMPAREEERGRILEDVEMGREGRGEKKEVTDGDCEGWREES